MIRGRRPSSNWPFSVTRDGTRIDCSVSVYIEDDVAYARVLVWHPDFAGRIMATHSASASVEVTRTPAGRVRRVTIGPVTRYAILPAAEAFASDLLAGVVAGLDRAWPVR